MNICIFSDVHWCQNSSIVRSRGEKYSTRLENLIESMNWAERLAWEENCDCIICCGDFFDAAVLNCEELSALQEIRWAPISHLFLTGNHETNVSSLVHSTVDLFKLCPNVAVMNTPQQYFIDGSNVEFCFLPYILEHDRKSITDYFGPATSKRVIFSHNDLKDVQYGSFLSTEGFRVDDIESNCNLYFNGHIHHCCNVTDKIINVGNLTGQNFTEDATKYQHCAVILDTNTLEYKYYENPYALKFYKIDATDCFDIESLTLKLNIINYNGVATVHVNASLAQDARDYLEVLKKDHIHDYRLLIKQEATAISSVVTDISNSVDHLKQFEKYVIDTFENTQILSEELQCILR